MQTSTSTPATSTTTATTITTTASLVALIQTRQAELGLTDQQLSEALGYERAIVIALIKQGTMRFPINKVPELAEALSVDAADLMRVALSGLDPFPRTVIGLGY